MLPLLLALLSADAPRSAPAQGPAVVRETSAPAAAAPDDRRWYPLTNRPGYYGYGRLNAAGELVVDWHCFGRGGQVIRGPVPELAEFPAASPNIPTSALRLPTPASQPQVFRYYYPALQSPCAGGNCPR